MGTSTKVHPRDFGFHLGIEATVSNDGLPNVISVSDAARQRQPVVYVALVDDDQPLKIGISGHGLFGRWKGILGVMDRNKWHRLRPNEVEDGKRLIKYSAGKKLSVWFKKPIRVQVPYATQVINEDFCGRHIEELFLDRYYQPLFGKRL